MPPSFSINSTLKKFFILYFSTMTIALVVMSLVYSIYADYITGLVKDLSRNPVMIRDTFSLRQSIVPLIKDDILEVRILDSVDNVIFIHSQNSNAFFSFRKDYVIYEKENVLYKIYLKMNLWKYMVILFSFGLMLIFSYYPFAKYEQKEYQNKSNQLLADLSKKLAHDIRTPISTLNLISSRITDQHIKELQLAVVKQINYIADNLLNSAKNQNRIRPTLETYESLFSQISQEYDLRYNLVREIIFFKLDALTEKALSQHSNILYPIICNTINNSIEAINAESGRIDVCAVLENNRIKITILDNGKGIPSEVLTQIGSRPLSFGKESSLSSGSGIALFNARKDLKTIGGLLKIRSILDQFTEVEISLPTT